MNNEFINLGTTEKPDMPEPPGSSGGAAETGRSRAGRRRLTARRGTFADEINLLRVFWLVVAVLVGYAVITLPGRPAAFTLSGLLVSLFALLPAYLWCRRAVDGLPVFPLFAGTYLLTHALQFLIASSKLRAYPAEAIWQAAVTTSAFLLVATLVWLYWVRLPRRLPPTCRVLGAQRGTEFLFWALAASTLVTLFDQAGWLTLLHGGMRTVVRQFFQGPTCFAIFILAMRWGNRSLHPAQVSLFIGLLIAYCLAIASAIFLVGAIIACLMLALGFIIGRQSVPWWWLVPMITALAVFHAGESEMRARYWGEGSQGVLVQPWNYPALYRQWWQDSLKQMSSRNQGGEEKESIFERAGTLNLMLQAQTMTPDPVAFLHGATYAIIPSALVPRLLDPQKASPIDSETLLNVHFGNQTVEETKTTTIGWGLLNEAYANFGYWGCFLLALILGTFYGLMTRWSIGLPPASLPALVGIFTLSFALQTEMTAAVYVTAYLQGLFALLVMAYPFMEVRPLAPATVINRRERWKKSLDEKLAASTAALAAGGRRPVADRGQASRLDRQPPAPATDL